MKNPKIEIIKLISCDTISASGYNMMLSGAFDSVVGDIKFNGDIGYAKNSEEFTAIYGNYYFFDDHSGTSTRGVDMVQYDGTYQPAFSNYNGEYYWDPERLLPWYMGYGGYIRKETK